MLRVVKDIGELAKKLASVQTSEETFWFRNLLVGILNAALRDYQSVQIGIAKSPHLATWGTRSLLELQTVTSSVLKGEEKALQFRDELLADITEFWQAMVTNNATTHKKLIEQMRQFGEGLAGAERDVILEAADQEEKKGMPVEPLADLNTFKRFALAIVSHIANYYRDTWPSLIVFFIR